MIEALLVILGVVALSLGGLLAPLLPPEWVVAAGGGGIALGLALGVPTGLWYHVALHRCLRARGPLPARWWLRPVALHGWLGAEERAGVLLWFYVGGAGFGLTLLGCGVVVLGVLLQAFRAGLL